MSELHLDFFWQGLAIGLAVAAPVGPISILCIQRTLKKGILSGYVSALGASFGDVLYTALGVFSLTLFASSFLHQATFLNVLSGGILCYLGLKIFFEKSTLFFRLNELHSALSISKHDLLRDYITIVLLDLVNPMTVLPFLAVFMELCTANLEINIGDKLGFILGVFLSGILWRLFLVASAHSIREHLSVQQLQWINWLSGIMIIAFGFVAFSMVF
ncbi:LysE family translocator [Spirulina subsalsa]|uniref:LysE family translocator n=1 Tax=Spirulina subsalsa TaxID=54311 RepID=UPI0002D7897C|nr:LysE family transporter [Spirulina subsalsa]